jgi:hypothetical protein
VSTAASEALPLKQGDQDNNTPTEDILPGTATPGGEHKTDWEVVAKTAGLIPAQIMAGRLKGEGIPTRYWQEGAGRAIGLTVGLLGTGYVMVPKSYAAEAEAILADLAELSEEEE